MILCFNPQYVVNVYESQCRCDSVSLLWLMEMQIILNDTELVSQRSCPEGWYHTNQNFLTHSCNHIYTDAQKLLIPDEIPVRWCWVCRLKAMLKETV